MDHVRAIFGPRWDHVLPSFTSGPDIALKYAKHSQDDLRHMSMEFLLFKTMSWPCLDLDWVMFGLFSHPDQLDF